MNPLVKEWICKAEGDFATACRELRARKAPNYDTACFHAQQCAEKYLKACLINEHRDFPKTHDLTALAEMLDVPGAWEHLRGKLEEITVYAVQYRYPGESADREEARRAIRITEEVRKRARKWLELLKQ